jgi:hypothetical protein
MKRHHPSEQVPTARCAVCEPADDLPRQRSEAEVELFDACGRFRYARDQACPPPTRDQSS